VKRILLSVFAIALVVGSVVGATTAFFSDEETSTGNILAAGALDLKVDNTCYYNGRTCVLNESTEDPTDRVWEGTDEPCFCTWELKDLAEGDVFFALRDLKPGDYEEDTISLHVDNDSWACVDINTTENSDNGITEPEDEVDSLPGDGSDGTPDGDLAQELNFIFWRDDGDNILEREEEVLTSGPASNVLNDVRWALADSETGQPLIGGEEEVQYIGKAFCFGTLTEAPLTPGDYPDGPAGDNNANQTPGEPEDGGFNCDGTEVGNISQTDLLMGDIVFEAVQARHNDDFLCNLTPTSTPTPLPL